MAQNNIVLNTVRRYTRADFTALRAYLNKLPVQHIATLYYSDDDLDEMGCREPGDFRRWLENMRDELIQRAASMNRYLAETLSQSRDRFIWSKAVIDYLVQAADQDQITPRGTDHLSRWFRPRLATRLNAEGCRTISDLIGLIHVRGHRWYHAIPGLGSGKATAIINWLMQHSSTVGDLDPQVLQAPAPRADLIVIRPGEADFAPIEQIAVSPEMSGEQGINRYRGLCLIAARNDLEAINAYLSKFARQPKTQRAYQKEIQRFYLWLIHFRQRPLSSILQDDCLAYMDFLRAIPDGGGDAVEGQTGAFPVPEKSWIAARTKRGTNNWRPFAGQLSPESQRYAIQTLRAFFAWLVGVRYLGGDPWLTVGQVPVAKPLLPMQIDKALPADLWRKLADPDGILDQLCATPNEVLTARYRLRGWSRSMNVQAQLRCARAAILLMGISGLRREEAVGALRNHLSASPDVPGLYDLSILGKRNKWRLTLLTERTMTALRAHWADRGLVGDSEPPMLSPVHLLAPLIASPSTAGNSEARPPAYTPDGIYKLVIQTLDRIANDLSLNLSETERNLLMEKTPHAFRHTFGRMSIEEELPLDVLQGLMGHESIQTTTIYAQSETKRKRLEFAKAFASKKHEG